MKSIEDIIIRMLVRKPFYAQIVSQFDRHETEEVTWAGVGYSGSNIILYYNPKKLLEEPRNIQEGVIEHEILHILSLHPFRREMRQPYVFNVSSDLAVNPMVGRQNLPKMTDEDEKEFGKAVGKKKGDSLVYFPDSFKPPLPEAKSAEEYYSLLMKDYVKFVGSGNCPNYQDKKSSDSSGEGGSQGESKEDGQSNKDSSQPTKKSCGDCAKNGNCERQKSKGGLGDFEGTGGSHKPWEEFGGTSESFGKVIVRDIVSKAINRCNRGRGDIPGNISEQVEALLESTVDWVSIIRFFGKAIRTSKKKSTWRKANWKFGSGTPGFKRKWKSKIAVACDSVTGDMPVMIKDKDGQIDIRAIADLADTWKKIKNGREIANFNHIFWNGRKWIEAQYISRHKYSGKIIRTTCHGGVIDTTPNHSLISKQDKLISAQNCRLGQRLCLPYGKVSWHRGLSDKSSPLFVGNEDLAWLYGFFAAEGSAWLHKRKRSAYYGNVTFSNKDKILIERAKSICETFFTTKWSVRIDQKGVYSLSSSNKYLYKFFRNRFYTKNCSSQKSYKKVPKEILNSPASIRLAFLKGYDDGDGDKKTKYGKLFGGFTTNSAILAQGLLWLIQTTTDLDYCVATRSDKPKIVTIKFSKDSKCVKNVVKAKFEYRTSGGGEYVYDIVNSKTNTFNAGVGLLKLHNTSGSISTKMLSQFASEILMLQRTGNEITVMDFDTKVNREYKIRKKSDFDSKFIGRGGTRIQSVIEYIDKKKRQPSGLVVLTDAEFGKMSKPTYPVLFCLTPGTKESTLLSNVTWAKTYVTMKDDRE